jgi:Uncharacterized conserved protein
MNPQRAKHTHKDPVCGMEVSYTTAVDEFILRGKTYYFCSRACREAFEVEPARYIRQHRQHAAGST